MFKFNRASGAAIMVFSLLTLPLEARGAEAGSNASVGSAVIDLPLRAETEVIAHNVVVEAGTYLGSPSLGVRKAPHLLQPDIDTFAYVPRLDFHNGIIEIDVAGRPMPDAASGARGFVGVAFRIDAADGTFACEGIYIRPTNARALDQLRRNHSTQYFAYPGYDFDRLRREGPGQYEAYVDLAVGEWTHLRIEVLGSTARLFVGGAEQPALIVNDLKRGADSHGAVGLYVISETSPFDRFLESRTGAVAWIREQCYRPRRV